MVEITKTTKKELIGWANELIESRKWCKEQFTDETIYVEYKDGTQETINPEDEDGTRKLSYRKVQYITISHAEGMDTNNEDFTNDLIEDLEILDNEYEDLQRVNKDLVRTESELEEINKNECVSKINYHNNVATIYNKDNSKCFECIIMFTDEEKELEKRIETHNELMKYYGEIIDEIKVEEISKLDGVESLTYLGIEDSLYMYELKYLNVLNEIDSIEFYSIDKMEDVSFV